MNLSLDRAPLAKALDVIRRIAPARTTVPILANVLLEAGAGRLILRATDLDLEAQTSVAADVASDGALSVSASILHDFVRKLPADARIAMQTDERGRLTLRCGRSRVQLQTLPVADWPSAQRGNYTHDFKIAASTLGHMIDKTSFAISNEETRYYLNGVYFHAAESNGAPVLRGVATDGHRLARIEEPLPRGAAGMPDIIVPRRTVAEVERLVKSAEGDAAVALDRNSIRFEIGDVTLTSKLIDGSFPDYQRIIPVNNDKRATLDREAAAQAADRVSTLITERGRAVKLTFGDDSLALSVVTPEGGEAYDEIEADYDGPRLEIGFNSRYLADALAAIDGDRVIVELADPGSPALLRSATHEDLIVLLMPMRV